MDPIELLSCSPKRIIIYPEIPPVELRPYGGSTALSVLEYFRGTSETVTHVTEHIPSIDN